MEDFKKLEVLKLAFDEFQRQHNPSHNGHQERCAIQCVKFSERLRSIDEYKEVITDEFLIDMKWVAELHDIGKSRIDEKILNRHGKLSPDQWRIVKAHPENGCKIIAAVRLQRKDVPFAVLHHHEKWDGTGYPEGLKEYDIPLMSRIMTMFDTLDAMTNERDYRQVFSVKHALEEMVKEVGISFDPKLFAVFLKFIKE
jgi:HD-GYP domain-containing protein (c-di-GMP phosphodiesterase class II)